MDFKGNNSALSTIHFDTDYSHEHVYLPYVVSLMCPTPSAALDRFINKTTILPMLLPCSSQGENI